MFYPISFYFLLFLIFFDHNHTEFPQGLHFSFVIIPYCVLCLFIRVFVCMLTALIFNC